jgi:hypothetical protein
MNQPNSQSTHPPYDEKSSHFSLTYQDETAGWNADPTPFVWNGKRRRRRERARLRRLAGSGAAMRVCKPIVS